MFDLKIRVTCLVCDDLFDMELQDITVRGRLGICPNCSKLEACRHCGTTLTDDNTRYHEKALCQVGGCD